MKLSNSNIEPDHRYVDRLSRSGLFTVALSQHLMSLIGFVFIGASERFWQVSRHLRRLSAMIHDVPA